MFYPQKEFIPAMRGVLARVYAAKSEDWNDWCRVGKDAQGKVRLGITRMTGDDKG